MWQDNTAQEFVCVWMQKNRVALDFLTALCGDDAAEAQADSLDNYFLKEKTEHVERAYWKEDRHDPDLR